MKGTYLSIWGAWLFPHGFRDYSLDNIRDWAKRESLAAEQDFVAQGVLDELRGLYPGCRRVGVLVHLHRDPGGRLSYQERPFVSVAALIRANEECRVFSFQLRYPIGGAGRVLFNFSSPRTPGMEVISSVSSSKSVCHKFLRLFKTLEEQGDDVSRHFDKSTRFNQILFSEEVFDAHISADLRANFWRDSENGRGHEVEFRLSPGLVPARSCEGGGLSEGTLQRLTEEFLSPYRWAFDHHPGTAEGFLALLEFLVRHGGCPSVVTTLLNRDSETPEVRDFREHLKKVTLLDHSINVARVMLKHLKETYQGRDYESLVPKASAVSFGHDLGKIPSLRSDLAYPDPDHPLVSAQKLEEIFRPQTAPPWFPDALDLVRHHHGPVSKDPPIPIRWADLRAREIEIEASGSGLKAIRWEEWFDVKRFLEILRPTVNILQGTRRFNALSLGPWVYCQPNFLYVSAGKLASQKGVIDLSLHILPEKGRALMKIVKSLRETEVLSSDIGESFTGRTYEVQTDTFNRRMFLIPLKIEVFGSPGWTERRKEGYLQLIRKVTPVKKIYL